MFIAIVFILPQINPVDSQTFNYAIVAVAIVMTYSMGFWLISARQWFTGPIQQIRGQCTLFIDIDSCMADAAFMSVAEEKTISASDTTGLDKAESEEKI